MADTTLQNDIALAEKFDDDIQFSKASVEDIQGTLEATVEETDKIQLSDHQQEMVDSYHSAAKTYKGDIYAVADKDALEAMVNTSGELIMDKSPSYVQMKELPESMKSEQFATQKPGEYWQFSDKFGTNVWGSYEFHGIVVPGTEGFMEVSAGIVKKAMIAFGNTIPKQYEVTAKGLKHYIAMAQKLRERLTALRPLLDKRDYPYRDVFEYGAYSRFFQFDGESISNFYQFQNAMDVQSRATQYVVKASESYGILLMERLLESLQQLQIAKEPDSQEMLNLRDSVNFHWKTTWKEAQITTEPGQTPQSAFNAFPERKFVSIAPLLDNRYLVAHSPKNDGGKDPVRVSEAIKHYGASVAFDKTNEKNEAQSMIVPNTDELSKLVTQTINTLYDIQGLNVLVDKNESFAKDFKKATDVLTKVMDKTVDNQFFGFLREYFKLATSIGTAVQQPYVQMVWLYIRCALVVTAMAELAVLEEPQKHVVLKQFFSKQSKEFSNTALESYQATQKALNAALMASSAK